MSSYRIALIPGDGIGVDVVTEACKVLNATGLKVETQNYDLGANRYLKSKETFILDGTSNKPKIGSYQLNNYNYLTEVKKFEIIPWEIGRAHV